MNSSEILIYILKVIAIHGAFFGFYFLLLRGNKNHNAIRSYLLLTLILGFMIPLMEIPLERKSEIMLISPAVNWMGPDLTTVPLEDQGTTLEKSSSVKVWTWFWPIAGLISFVLLSRSIFHLFVIQKLKNKSIYVTKKWFKLFKTNLTHPFSFFSNVFIPKPIFATNTFREILTHECEHVRQGHSFDRLLVDLIASLFWFNPFIILYRNALIEIHEYQADSAVIQEFGDTLSYQETLYSQLQHQTVTGLVSHFNFSLIKKRIVMMNKTNNKTSKWIFAPVLPLTLVLVFAFAGKNVHYTPTVKLKSGPFLNEVIDHDQVLITILQDENRPSILPLQNPQKMRLTSPFGMRKDPFDGQTKMHFGIDLATATGTRVIATADGVVDIAKEGPNYGKWITIKHGEQYETLYSQLSELRVQKGDQVKKGQVIALSGNSGRSTAPHLHYSITRIGKGKVDPVLFIQNHKFEVDLPPVPPVPAEKGNLPQEEIKNLQLEEQKLALEKQVQEQEKQTQEMELQSKLMEEQQRALEMEAKMIEDEQRLKVMQDQTKKESEIRQVKEVKEIEQQRSLEIKVAKEVEEIEVEKIRVKEHQERMLQEEAVSKVKRKEKEKKKIKNKQKPKAQE